VTQLPVILKALKRHKIAVAVLLLEFAITFALLSNASILVWQRFSALRTISGVQEQGLLVANVTVATLGAAPPTADKLNSAIAAIESIRGVRAVSLMSQTPFSGVDSLLGRVSRTPGAGSPAHEISVYFGDRKMLAVLGSHLVAGRWFSADEYSHPADMPGAAELQLVILTRHLASKLFPQEDPLGKTISSRDRPMIIIGLLDHLARPAYQGADLTEDAGVFPVVPPPIMPVTLAIRLDATASSDEVLVGKSIELLLNDTFKGSQSWRVLTYERQRDAHFASDKGAFRIMLFLLAGLLAVAVNAVAGLSFYWVNQRANHVATRRALGALRREVIEYFLLENLVICIAGVVIGVALTMSINTWTVVHFNAVRMPVMPMLIGFALATLTGQCAVAYPAWRIGSVEPSVAARL
jgi:putative ABC transport system permease protein